MYHIKIPADMAARKVAGAAIIRLSDTVFKTGPAGNETEWQAFERDPAAWLYKYGYRLEAPGAPADGSFSPGLLRLIPVYDSPHTMHVRVPCRENIDTATPPPPASDYGPSFEAFLATYFTRQCR